MKPSTRKFELKYLRVRNSIERKGISMVTKALRAQYNQYLEKIAVLPMSMWVDAVESIKEAPIRQFFETFYPMSARLGLMTRENMLSQKSIESDLWLYTYQRKMRGIITEAEYAERIVTITNTTKTRINSVLKDVLTDAEVNGYGVDKTAMNLRDALKNNFRGNARARAKVIAQTEMISASNQASSYAADSTGLEYRKYWSTSHLAGIRPSHIQAEQDSIQRGGLKKDERFANGLLYPGDPAGDASEVCNCRCTCLFDIV